MIHSRDPSPRSATAAPFHRATGRIAALLLDPLPALAAAALVCLFSAQAHAVAGIEGTFEYAFDAPWRIEPSIAGDGSREYGAIPIQLTIHDVEQIPYDGEGRTLGNVCNIQVTERRHDGSAALASYGFDDLAEVEWGGRWRDRFEESAPHWVCRAWQGEDCAGLDYLTTSSEWHGLLWHEPSLDFAPGETVELEIQVSVSEATVEVGNDPALPCDTAGPSDRITLINDVSVELASDPLPRFGEGWIYGDLHYHSQGTDNEGEAGYNYRGVARAMGAMGLDFVFATEHASNADQIVDADVEVDPFVITEHGTDSALRDMSDFRFRYLQGQLRAGDGVNAQAAEGGFEGRLPQGVLSHGVVPQIFLGGELDVIPEVDAATELIVQAPHPVFPIPWGNGMFSDLFDLCGGWKWAIDVGYDCRSLLIESTDDVLLLEPVGDTFLVKDVQAINQIDYGRLHMVYLPRDPSFDAFVASDTGTYGGARRRLSEPHAVWPFTEKPAILPEIEEHGYAFLAHPLSGTGSGNNGPDSIPWTDPLLEKAWSSPAILGLQLWNEDTRLEDEIAAWDSAIIYLPDGEVPATASDCGYRGFGWSCWLPVPGDDIGYERNDDVSGADNRDVPHESRRAGLDTGQFRLTRESAGVGRWEKYSNGVEKNLHHGAFTWDRLNHWGLDVRLTEALDWLPAGEPRRFFMAGGSDAHGDLNYRREGYFLGIDKLTDTAIGKPRNLLDAGRADSTAPGGGALYRQQQIVETLADGRFSITDGPALRLFVDHDGDCEFDRGDTAMGGMTRFYGSTVLPVCVEWKSTPEFGPVEKIDLYVGARASSHDLTHSEHERGRTYAPAHHGPRSREIPASVASPPDQPMEDDYWPDPTGQLRIPSGSRGDLALIGQGYAGRQLVRLDLSDFDANDGTPADRFFVRAVATNHTANDPICVHDVGNEELREDAERRGECIRRYAFTNPVWAVEGEPETLWLEAEDGQPAATTTNLRAPMQVADQALASGGSFVHVPEGSSGEGRVSHLVLVSSTGHYRIWGRTAAQSPDQNAFIVSVLPYDGGEPIVEPLGGSSPVVWAPPSSGLESWVWDAVNDGSGNGPAEYPLVAGRYYWIVVSEGDEGTRLDRLALSNDPEFDPTGHHPEPTYSVQGTSYRVDWCFQSGTACGAPAAHAYCANTEGEGWVAASFAMAADIGSMESPTLMWGAWGLCADASCDGFEYIECHDSRQSFSTPSWSGDRVDWCLDYGSDCGQPAADAFCALENGSGWHAIDFVKDVDVGPTRTLGDRQWCTSYDCDGFAEIVCAINPVMTDVPNDTDQDGVPDSVDSCPHVPDVLQRDGDGDGIGDVCDEDPLAPPACSDGIDNDGDGLQDANDPGCLEATDRFETSLELICDDGYDNDGDGLADYPFDPDCESPLGFVEQHRCDDGIDQDNDGLIDLDDPDCNDETDDSEYRLEPGDIIAAITGGPYDPTVSIVRVDPETGEQMIIHSGRPLVQPGDVVIDDEGDLMILDSGAAGLLRLHVEDGRFDPFTSAPSFSIPRYIAREPDGNYVVCDEGRKAVVRVDAESGTTETLPGGTGVLGSCEGIAVSPAGTILVSDIANGSLVRIDPQTNLHTTLRPGPAYHAARDVEFLDERYALVVDGASVDTLFRVDLQSVSQTAISIRQNFIYPTGIALAADGTIHLGDWAGMLHTIDPAGPAHTNQAILAWGGHLNGPGGIVVYPMPTCSNGIDDDGDGLVDHPADPECAHPDDWDEAKDEIDLPEPGLALAMPAALSMLAGLARRRRLRLDALEALRFPQ